MGISTDVLQTEHTESECDSTTKAGTVAMTKARIYDIIGWVNTINGYNSTRNRYQNEFLHGMRVFLWMERVYENRLAAWNRRVQIL